MRHVRLALEILGAALYLAVHLPIAFVYILGSSLRGVHPVPYWAAIAAGYMGMLVLALMRPGRLKVTPRRYLLDLWLLAAVPAVLLSWFLAIERWPLEFPNWGGHGFGASGGEVNAAFFPWVQGVLWVLGASMVRTVFAPRKPGRVGGPSRRSGSPRELSYDRRRRSGRYGTGINGS